MKMKEKPLFFLVLILITLFCFGVFGLKTAEADVIFENPFAAEDFQEFVDRVVGIVWTIAIVVVPGLIILGAFYLLTSFGNPEKIKVGQNIILYTVIGFVIIMVSGGIIDLLREEILEIGHPWENNRENNRVVKPPQHPKLQVSPSTITATLTRGDPWTNIGTIDVTNPGVETLTWSAAEELDWLAIDPKSDTTTNETDTVLVMANATDLAVGSHSGIITFTGESPATGSPATVTVTLNVVPLPLPPIAEAKQVIFVTTAKHHGNFDMIDGVAGNARDDLDYFCRRENMPRNLQLAFDEGRVNNITAFVSVDGGDTIPHIGRNMGVHAGKEFSWDKPIYWWHPRIGSIYRIAENWYKMLDGDIETSQYEGTEVGGFVWTGAVYTGGLGDDHCINWTSRAGWTMHYGNVGISTHTDKEWLNRTSGIGPGWCISNLNLRCIFLYTPKPSIMFVTTAKHTGNFAGRADAGGDARTGLDNFCKENMPANLEGRCENITAFVSVDGGDQIWQMRHDPISAHAPIYWWHPDYGETGIENRRIAEHWRHMLRDEDLPRDIETSQKEGTGVEEPVWTGSDYRGRVFSGSTCNGWTTDDGYYSGRRGDFDETDKSWLSHPDISCSRPLKLRCICN